VLYFAPHQLWPLTTGARLRDYHLASQLAHKGCEVTFVETLHPNDRKTKVPDVGFRKLISLVKNRSYTPEKVVRGIIGPQPITVLNLFSPAMEAKLTEVLRDDDYDIVQVEGSPLAAYLSVIRKARSRPSILLDWHNIESELMRRYAESTPNLGRRFIARRTAHLLEQTEQGLLENCDAHAVASNRERETLLSRAPQAEVQVIPNGVDTEYYSPAAVVSSVERIQETDRRLILYVGSMDYHANIDAVTWFARSAWPELARRDPELTFAIVGRNPSPEVLALASKQIEVTGTVDDIRPYYARALAVVVPLRVGSGTRLKILEAMAAGVPIVSTRLGAEGIEAAHDVHLLLADGEKEMVASVNQLTGSPEMRTRLREAARELVVSRYAWPVIGASLYAMHERLIRMRTQSCSRSHLPTR
jgi:sugar transferase (PEP-CTERM/EpsH1 system associated)